MIKIYIIGIFVYLSLPFPLKLIFLILNTFIPDSIPFLDEIIMYASALSRLEVLGDIIEFITEHIILSICIGISIVVLADFLFGF